MLAETPRWMNQGAGKAPDSVLSFRAEAPITAFSGMRECGDFVFADELGTLYRLDPLLNVTLLTRLQDSIQRLVWSDTGQSGVALLGKNILAGLNEKLKVLWSVELPFACSALAIDPFGKYLLAASADSGVLLLDERGKKLGTIETIRPLAFAEFLASEPVILAAAEHGLIGAYGVPGKVLWQETVWSSVGDLAVIQKQGLTCLAALNHGIQVFNGQGQTAATIVLEGTVNRIAASYNGNQILAATVEHQLYRLDAEGQMLWAANSEHPVQALYSHPLGKSGVVVLDKGTALRLEW